MKGRVLALDPGEKRLGVAVSDETRTLARGLAVIRHVSLQEDCTAVLVLARENQADLIVVGTVLDENGEERPQTRHAKKLAETLTNLSGLKTVLWDETDTTKQAWSIRKQSGASKQKRSGHLDEVAAALLLQSYLDSMNDKGEIDA